MPYKRRTKVRDPEEQDTEPVASSHVPHKASLWVEAPIYLLIFFCPLALGTTHLWSTAVMCALACVSFGALAYRRRRQRRSFLLFPMGLALAAACLLCVLQLLPLPEFLLRIFNPGAGSLYDYLLVDTPLWGQGNFRAASLDTPATAAELVRFLAYLLAFVVVVNYFNERHRARRLLKAVAWCGFTVALIGFFSKLFMAQKIFGLHPVAPGIFFFSTFVNPNHLAGFLGLCSPVALGLALSARGRQDRALYGFMGVIIGVALFMSLSRGGIVAYSAGLVLLFFFVATRRARKLRHTALVQTAMAGVLLLAGYLAYDTVIEELKTLGDIEAVQEETKIRSWAATLPMMADHPVVGIGKGAYRTVYPRYKTVEADRTFHHAENQLLQVMVEWGPLFGFLFAGVLGLTFVLGVTRLKSSQTLAGCLAGVFIVAAHNLVDFNLEVGGVALPFVVVLAVVCASPFSHAGRPRDFELRPRLSGLAAAVLLPLVFVVAAAATAWAASNDLADDTEALLAAAASGPAEPCEEVPLGRAACDMMRSHPADFMTPLVVGKAFLDEPGKKRIGRAVHWLARAMYLNPTQAVTHRLLGRSLFFAGHVEQAVGEYRLAARWDPGLLTTTTTEVLRLTGDTDKAIQATPPGGETYLKVARNLRTLGRDQAAGRAARLALEQDSTLLHAMDLLADLAFEKGRLEEVAGLARRQIEVDPLYDRAYLLKGQVLAKQGEKIEAERAWLNGLQQAPESIRLAHTLVDLYLREGRLPAAESIAARLQNFVAGDDRSQARLQILIGRINEAKGMLYEARRAYRFASELVPGSLAYLYRVARIEQRMANWEEALRIYRLLKDTRYQPERMGKLIEQVEKARRAEKDRAMWDKWVKEKEEAEGKD